MISAPLCNASAVSTHDGNAVACQMVGRVDPAYWEKLMAMPGNFHENLQSQSKPLLVSSTRARAILDIRSTKFWAMVKSGKIKMVHTGGRRLVLFASLEALAGQGSHHE